MDRSRSDDVPTLWIVAFTLVACGMAWTADLIELVLGREPGVASMGDSVALLRAIVLSTRFAPALAALIVSALAGGHEAAEEGEPQDVQRHLREFGQEGAGQRHLSAAWK